MYTVHMERECSCFKKSEYESEKSFQTQQEAYNYSNILAELMNEDFCGKHQFVAEKMDGDLFLIRVSENPNSSGSCGTDSNSSCSTGSCGCE